MAVQRVEYKYASSTSGFASAGDEVVITSENADIIKKDVDEGNTENLSSSQSSYLDNKLSNDKTEYQTDGDESSLPDEGNKEGSQEKEGGSPFAQEGGPGAGTLAYAVLCAQSSIAMNRLLPVNMVAAVDLGCSFAQLAMSLGSNIAAATFDANYNERIQLMNESESKESEVEEHEGTLDDDISELDTMINELEDSGVLEEGAKESTENITREDTTTQELPEEEQGEENELSEDIVDEEVVDEAITNNETAVEQSEEKEVDSKFLQVGHSLGAQGLVATSMLGAAAGLNLSTAAKTSAAAARYASFVLNPYMLAQAALDVAATKNFVASSAFYGTSSLIMGVKSGRELLCGNKGDSLSDKISDLNDKQTEHQAKIDLVGGETADIANDSNEGSSASTDSSENSGSSSSGGSTTT